MKILGLECPWCKGTRIGINPGESRITFHCFTCDKLFYIELPEPK